MELLEAIRRLRNRAHVHTDACRGPEELNCWDRHAHEEASCYSRPLECQMREEPELVMLLAEYDRLVQLPSVLHEMPDPFPSRPPAAMSEEALKHVCGLQGFGALGDVCEACAQRR